MTLIASSATMYADAISPSIDVYITTRGASSFLVLRCSVEDRTYGYICKYVNSAITKVVCK